MGFRPREENSIQFWLQETELKCSCLKISRSCSPSDFFPPLFHFSKLFLRFKTLTPTPITEIDVLVGCFSMSVSISVSVSVSVSLRVVAFGPGIDAPGRIPRQYKTVGVRNTRFRACSLNICLGCWIGYINKAGNQKCQNGHIISEVRTVQLTTSAFDLLAPYKLCEV